MKVAAKKVRPVLKQLLGKVKGDTVKLVTEDNIRLPYTNDGVTIFVPKQMGSYTGLASYATYEVPNNIKHLDLTEFEFFTDDDILLAERMFNGWVTLETVDFGSNPIECDELYVSSMFFGCPNLKEIDLSNFRARYVRMENLVNHTDVHIIMPRTYGSGIIEGDGLHAVSKITVQEGYVRNIRDLITRSVWTDVTTEFHIPESVVDHLGEDALEDLGDEATVVVY